MRYENIQNFMVVNNIIVLSEYEQFIKGLKSKYGNGERIACILFADPNNDDVVSGYIDNRFDYLNERSGKYVDFFCPGYYYRQNRRKFDTKKYVKFLKDLEARSKWQYNGGTNLLLIRYCNGALHFDNVYDINFTRMTAEGLH